MKRAPKTTRPADLFGTAPGTGWTPGKKKVVRPLEDGGAKADEPGPPADDKPANGIASHGSANSRRI